MKQSKTIVLGITGGVGSGKSAVLEHLEKRYGAKIFFADQIAKMLLLPGELCYNEVRKIFPQQVFTDSGEIHREKMAEFIFSNPEYRWKQNEIVFPAVRKYLEEQLEAERKKGTSLVVIEAALLIEEHYDEICDRMWYVFANEENRRKRLQQSRGYSDEKITAIIRSQLSEEEFRTHTDAVIDNNGLLKTTYECIERKMREMGLRECGME